jgi:hypothetical protein
LIDAALGLAACGSFGIRMFYLPTGTMSLGRCLGLGTMTEAYHDAGRSHLSGWVALGTPAIEHHRNALRQSNQDQHRFYR